MEFPLSLIEIAIAFGIIIIGAVLQGSIGFGLGPFCAPLLVLLNPEFIPGPLLLTALFLTLLMFQREKHFVKINEIKWAVVGRVVGTILGALVLTLISRESLSLFFGIMILLAVLILISGVRPSLTTGNLIGTGMLSGFMGTTASIGGPPLALLYQNKKGPQIRGTLSGIFIVGTIIAIVSLLVIGKFGVKELLFASVMIPGVVIGFFISNHTLPILDRGFMKPVILVISAISSVFIIVKSIFF